MHSVQFQTCKQYKYFAFLTIWYQFTVSFFHNFDFLRLAIIFVDYFTILKFFRQISIMVKTQNLFLFFEKFMPM